MLLRNAREVGTCATLSIWLPKEELKKSATNRQGYQGRGKPIRLLQKAPQFLFLHRDCFLLRVQWLPFKDEPQASLPTLISSVCRAVIVKTEEIFQLIAQARWFFFFFFFWVLWSDCDSDECHKD